MRPRALPGTVLSFGYALFLLVTMNGSGLADAIQGGPACAPNGPDNVCFGMPPAPSGGIVRQINYAAPGPGKALVMVNGSGWCTNFYTEAEEVANFATQIVNKANATVDPGGPGGLRFNNRIPRATAPSNSNIMVPINYGSSRTFPVNGAGTQKYFLKLTAYQLGQHVSCNALSLNMTILFIAD